ncbi:MAG TPA: enoyl-CoA hydratase-related protein [Bryobacteraceae bacterium]|jgi:enoyl-CoA hydratase|nr:enoyl-CoA hydratase-related protein [Bryobacteraceae bacterium]
MSFQFLSFESDADGLALVTVTRPEKLNALNRTVISELGEAFRKVREDDSIKALILTGAGEKAFVAGADIGELASIDGVQAELLSRRGQEIFRALETLRKPSVAAINGYALGGGLELAMCCTIRIASHNAKLGQPEVKLGIVPGYGATQRLPRLVGRGRALELLLSGEPIDAAEAYRIGLVNALAPQEELIATAKQWARKVVANGPLAVALTMESVDAGLDGGLQAGLRFEAMAFGLTAASDDRREGTTAFLEKRKPVFSGK